MRVARVLLAGLAAWGLVLTLLLASDRWPLGRWPLHARSPQHPDADAATAGAAACDCTAAGGAAPVQPPGPSAAPDSIQVSPAAKVVSSIVAARYAVCAREESPPALSRVHLTDKGSGLWALHCGPSVHLIAVEDSGAGLTPRRVLHAQAQSHSAAEAARAVRVSAADIDGDGRSDLLVPVLFTDRAGAPASGLLSVLRQRAEGGFDIATRMLDGAVGDVMPARLDAQAGSDIALLHLADARAARTSELWLVHGGPSPQRYARLPAGVGADALAVADLDRDGLDDLAVVSEHESRVRIWLSSSGTAPALRGGASVTGADPTHAPLEFELEGVREALAGDVDGDGASDLVLTGARVSVLLASKDAAQKPTAIAGSEGLRDVHLEDVNGDGKLDLIGYAHPDVIALQRSGALEFERHTLATLRGDFGLLFARAAQLDDDARPDLVLAVVANTSDAQIEFALAANVHDGIAVELAEHAEPVQNATLASHFILP